MHHNRKLFQYFINGNESIIALMLKLDQASTSTM